MLDRSPDLSLDWRSISYMSTPEKHPFQAEIAQLLDIVVNSLYTDKEIFVRELISNAADASEKLKFLQTSGTEIRDPEKPLRITVTTDDQAKTITFTDAGLGMTHAELIENLGTIAHSGSRLFLEQVKASQGNANLIGQFGVGFYSAYMVADQVTVFTRSYKADEPGWKWTSDGKTGYEIEPADDLERGTRITLHLRDGEFAAASNIERIIKHYSNFVPFPIELNGTEVNTVQAIWTRSKSEVSETDYEEFYKFVGHDTQPPMLRLHFQTDAPLAIQALFFVPQESFEMMGMQRGEPEVNLYCRKVLIQPKSKTLLPEWLRFLRGVADCEDIPLNISRESMQDSSLMRRLNDILTKRVLKWLEEESKNNPEKYETFFKTHGHCLKEGTVQDWTHRDALGKLLRFPSSAVEADKTTGLADYIARMPEGQTDIYYLQAPNREGALASAYYEVFREKKWEVLFLTDPRDEFVLEHLRTFDSKKLVAAEKADLKLESESGPLSEEDARLLAEFMKEKLASRVHDVRVSQRLVDSPAAVVESDLHMTSSMRRMLKAMDKGGSHESLPNLEINPRHPMLVRLDRARKTEDRAELAAQVSQQILDNALMAAGLLEDPREMLARLNDLLQKVLPE